MTTSRRQWEALFIIQYEGNALAISSERGMSLKSSVNMSRCSFGIKQPLPHEKPSVGPGPQQYNVDNTCTRYGPQRAPSFTLGKRLTLQPDNGIPGPGAYYPVELKTSQKSTAPGFSLLGRTSVPDDNKSPGPASYTLPEVIGKGTAPRLKGRKCIAAQVSDENPGPANYGLPDVSIYKWKTPTFSMSGRKRDPFLNPAMSETPAPWAYNREYKPAKARSGCSFGQRHSTKCTNLILPNDKT